eukprot:scaffold12240_cov170-Amphora_coffeaeformis.AAC.5
MGVEMEMETETWSKGRIVLFVWIRCLLGFAHDGESVHVGVILLGKAKGRTMCRDKVGRHVGYPRSMMTIVMMTMILVFAAAALMILIELLLMVSNVKRMMVRERTNYEN